MAIEKMETMLSVGGKSNSLGRVGEVVDKVLSEKACLGDLYDCMFCDDPWVRMRAADAFEKVCRERPEWIKPYISRMQMDLSGTNQQASIQWHMAQIYQQVELTKDQRSKATTWLARLLSSSDNDWIVSTNAMKALVYFTQQGDYSQEQLLHLLKIQSKHRSNAVVKKAKEMSKTLLNQ